MNSVNPKSSARIVATLSGKGGTGKSIITVSMGYILANCGFRTLLVDVDLFTGGMSFYSLAGNPRRSNFTLQDLFLGKYDLEATPVQAIAIPAEFCSNKLFLLPALSKGFRNRSELALHPELRDVPTFSVLLRDVISMVGRDFEYILMDTRGGTDITSVSSALVSDGFIIVTEADKTSWDVGEVLLTAISEAAEKGLKAQALGFVINKNVLPPDAIVTFLRQRWDCPHLVTIPLDEHAIRFYQEDKVPVAEDAACPFSASLIPIVRKLFVDESWPTESLMALSHIENQAKTGQVLRRSVEETQYKSERYSVLLKLYGTGLSTMLLFWLAIDSRFRSFSIMQSGVAILAALLIFLMTASDPKVIASLFGSRARKAASERSADIDSEPVNIQPSDQSNETRSVKK